MAADQNDEVLITAEPLEFARSDHSEDSQTSDPGAGRYRIPGEGASLLRPLSPKPSPKIASESGSVSRRPHAVPCATVIPTVYAVHRGVPPLKQRPFSEVHRSYPPRSGAPSTPEVLRLAPRLVEAKAAIATDVACVVQTLSGQLVCEVAAKRDWRVLQLKDAIAEEVKTPQGIWDLSLKGRALEDPTEQPLLGASNRVELAIVQLSPAEQCSKALRVAHRASHSDPEVQRWAKEELLRLHAGGFDPVVQRSQPTPDVDDLRATPYRM